MSDSLPTKCVLCKESVAEDGILCEGCCISLMDCDNTCPVCFYMWQEDDYPDLQCLCENTWSDEEKIIHSSRITTIDKLIEERDAYTKAVKQH